MHKFSDLNSNIVVFFIAHKIWSSRSKTHLLNVFCSKCTFVLWAKLVWHKKKNKKCLYFTWKRVIMELLLFLISIASKNINCSFYASDFVMLDFSCENTFSTNGFDDETRNVRTMVRLSRRQFLNISFTARSSHGSSNFEYKSHSSDECHGEKATSCHLIILKTIIISLFCSINAKVWFYLWWTQP